MRFIAWNCNERFGRNYLHLRDLDFDVAVVTECGPFEPGLGEVREVSSVLKLAVDHPGTPSTSVSSPGSPGMSSRCHWYRASHGSCQFVSRGPSTSPFLRFGLLALSGLSTVSATRDRQRE